MQPLRAQHTQSHFRRMFHRLIPKSNTQNSASKPKSRASGIPPAWQGSECRWMDLRNPFMSKKPDIYRPSDPKRPGGR